VAQLEPKPVSASRTTLAQLMQPQHANNLGTVHGGVIMKLVDEVGAIACVRHAGHRVVTVAIDQMMFQHPIRIGHLVILTAEVSYVGRTSMEAEVRVVAENPITGEQVHTNTAYVVYVAVDERGRPVPVPPLLLENEAQRQRFEQAKARQAFRLQQREQARRAYQNAEEADA